MVTINPVPTVVFPATANVTASVADDGLPNPPGRLTLVWGKVTGPGSVTFNPVNAASTIASFGTPGSYVLRLSATDGATTSSSAVTVFVAGEETPPPPNDPPVVSAGSDQAIDFGDTASLNGTATDDGLPFPGRLSITWTKVSGPGDVSIFNPSQPATTATFTAPGVYVLRLFASDGERSASKTVKVTIREAKDYLSTYENTQVRCGSTGLELRILNTHQYESISYTLVLRLSTVFGGELEQKLQGLLLPGESRSFGCSERSPGPGYGYLFHTIAAASFSTTMKQAILAANGADVGPELTYGVSSTGFALSWPSIATDAILEVADELGADARWEPVIQPAVLEEDRQKVVLPLSEAKRFFRLKLP